MKTRTPLRFAVLTGLTLILGLEASSQFRTRVDLVVVPVSVRDNNGGLVPGLGRQDFSVFEDGRPQVLSSFAFDAQPLSVAIVIDDAISSNALKRLTPAIHSLVLAFTPDDEIASFRYDHFVWRLSDFTRDPVQLEKSFDELIKISDARPKEPEQPALYSKIEKKTPGFVRALAGLFGLGSNGAPPMGGGLTAPSPRSAPDSHVLHSAIQEAAVALRDRPKDRRKIILVVSDGVVAEPQISVIPGKTLNSFDRNRDVLLTNDIQVYAVNTERSLLERKSGALDEYASTTGGDAYGGIEASDIQFAFKRIPEQARTEYVLGYVSNNTAPRLGVYRKIEVRSGAPDQQRRVSHRQGYMQYANPQ